MTGTARDLLENLRLAIAVGVEVRRTDNLEKKSVCDLKSTRLSAFLKNIVDDLLKVRSGWLQG